MSNIFETVEAWRQKEPAPVCTENPVTIQHSGLQSLQFFSEVKWNTNESKWSEVKWIQAACLNFKWSEVKWNKKHRTVSEVKWSEFRIYCRAIRDRNDELANFFLI